MVMATLTYGERITFDEFGWRRANSGSAASLSHSFGKNR